jgi:GT2 family glycosyltransferase
MPNPAGMMPKRGPRVAVGIVTFNSRQDIPAALGAVRRQTHTPIDIFVFDNGSSDGTLEWLKANAVDCHVLGSDTNLGFAKGQNAILRNCELGPGDWYMALNPDAVIAPEYTEELIKGLEIGSAAWGCGKLVSAPGVIYSAGHALRRDGYAIHIGHGLPDDGTYDVSREVFGAPGAASAMSFEFVTAVADDGQLFEEAFFLYGEDVDLDWRGRLKGFRCMYIPAAVAQHRGSKARGRLRDGALVNRYLAVLKNAFLADLLTYNLPIMTAHVVIRTLVSPISGGRMLFDLIRLSPRVWPKRTHPMVSRREMLAWFLWSNLQVTGQPIGSIERIRDYLRQIRPGDASRVP